MWVRDDDNFIDQYFDPSGARYQPPGDRFEIDHLEVALKYVKNFRVAIDGGAYYGSWARYMAVHFGDVQAFEPNLDTCVCLHRNTHPSGNVSSICVSLGNLNGQSVVGKGKMYHHPGMDTVLATIQVPSDSSLLSPDHRRMITIDSLSLHDLDFLKLDIEGYEYFALQGAVETLKRCHPVVMFEENIRGELEHGVEPGSCDKLLTDLGATLVDRIGSDHIYAWED